MEKVTMSKDVAEAFAFGGLAQLDRAGVKRAVEVISMGVHLHVAKDLAVYASDAPEYDGDFVAIVYPDFQALMLEELI